MSESPKLLQESSVTPEEVADIGDAVFEHGTALRAHAKGKAGVALWINPRHLEHARVHHAAAHHLQPAAPPLHIHLGAGFGEGKVGRPKAQLHLSFEKGFQEMYRVLKASGEAWVFDPARVSGSVDRNFREVTTTWPA